MMKKSLSLLVAIMMMVSFASVAMAATTGGVLVTPTNTTLRTSSAVNAIDMVAVPGNAVLNVVETDMNGRWAKCTYTDYAGQSYTGWIVDPSVHVAVVICQRLTLRASASNSSTSLGRVKHGAVCTLLDSSNPDWYLVEADVNGTMVQGYVHAPYVIEDPQYLECGGTVLYAWNSRNAKRVGQVTGSYLIIGETDSYYIISYLGGSAFVRK